MTRRVVVTGMGGISPLGHSWKEVRGRLRACTNAIAYMPEWAQYEGLNTRLAAPVAKFELPTHYNRKVRRSMSPVSEMAVRATELALEDAGLIGDPILKSGRTGVSYGSSTGGTEAVRAFGQMFLAKATTSVKANTYIHMMPHTTAFNISSFFGITGRLLPSSTACTSGSLAIGIAYETIKFGMQDVMVAGGGEELCPSEATVFDTLFATSTKNDTPQATPRPFDRDRDGLVIGEGAGTLVLEGLERARARGARIYAELVGFGTNSDGRHATNPTTETMAEALRLALESAGLPADAIAYINAHGTATELGDIAESQATEAILGKGKPISSLKSYMGHTLGACGALEAWMSIHMMRESWVAPTLNLDVVDARCGDLDYVKGTVRPLDMEYVMSNSFAFGGVNTSLIFHNVDA